MIIDFKQIGLARWWRWIVLNKLLMCLPWAWRYQLADTWGRVRASAHIDYAATVSSLSAVDWGREVSETHLTAWIRDFFGARSCDVLDCEQMRDKCLATYRQHVRLKGERHLREAMSSGRGVIIITSHFGRMPMHGPAFALNSIQAGLLTATVDQRNGTMHKLDRWFHHRSALRTQQFLQGEWFMTSDNPRRMLRSLQAGHGIFIVLDGLETDSKMRIEAPFLGGVINLPAGIIRLAARTNARMVFSTAAHRPGGRVEVSIQDLPYANPELCVRHAIRLLEEKVLEEPGQWWMWPHLSACWRPGTERHESRA